VADGSPRSVAVVGMSVGPVCGARDHAVLLADALGAESFPCSLHWLSRETESLRGARSEIRGWLRALAGELDRSRPDVVLLHYSVFACSYRGLPLFVSAVMRALRRARIPVVTVLHEFVYPWRHGGARGKVWALTQRALLIDVMHSSTAVVVTTDFRAEWLATRPWLPGRKAVLAPVFSNLPPPTVGPPAARPHPVVGLFGYSFQGAAVSLVLAAVALLRDRGIDVQLMLLGAPGRPSAAADMWLQAARARDIEHALPFSGTLSAQDLSNALASCEVLLFADASGPSSRKGTLAASLASGRPVVAVDGSRRWLELIQADAARVVQPTPRALADAIHALLADRDQRELLGARGRAFAEQKMSLERTTEVVGGLLAGIADAR
jgi:glycosyltransferase involved in cell wall biosynthesis